MKPANVWPSPTGSTLWKRTRPAGSQGRGGGVARGVGRGGGPAGAGAVFPGDGGGHGGSSAGLAVAVAVAGGHADVRQAVGEAPLQVGPGLLVLAGDLLHVSVVLGLGVLQVGG